PQPSPAPKPDVSGFGSSQPNSAKAEFGREREFRWLQFKLTHYRTGADVATAPVPPLLTRHVNRP
ncbi:hypothetical protein, partial [Xanthobacter autotrophicus]|uniref:hypothetical protein n=1 Tax=Xanthobacter autotrophicus TaxID=280 RepID=UPI0024A669EA